MNERLIMIGFGEAAQAFAAELDAAVIAFDRKVEVAETRAATRAEADALGVAMRSTNAAAVAGAPLILSLVTADQALPAAIETARSLAPGALFCDMNSVAPETKRAAAAAIEAAGGRYVDVAVMAPVHPLRCRVPLLLAGPHAAAAAAAIARFGFVAARTLDGPVGQASAIKMIRSVIVKGMEALTAECLLAAEAAGVRDEVIASLDASERPRSWAERADYQLDRMMVHGLRRADELDEVVRTLNALGTGAAMVRAAAGRQRAIGRLRRPPPAGLAAKLTTLRVIPATARSECAA